MSSQVLHEVDVAFSPCPNDTFLFHGLVNGKIDVGPFRFRPSIEDVEELNNRAFSGIHALTKLSFYAALLLKDHYTVLGSGAALGYGCGPLVVARGPLESIENAVIAVPGRYTTAYLLLQLWQGRCKNVVFTRFDDILPGVASGRYDAGLIIHEGRFVYPAYNCVEIIDLGKWWESETGLPVPLGCIALRHDLLSHKGAMEALLRASVLYHRQNPGDGRDFIRRHAQEMDDQVIEAHISLYVNEFTLSLGDTGMKAINLLHEHARARGIL